MKAWKRILRRFGLSSYVLIPNKDFEDLSDEEFAFMIDADLAGGNNFFDASALAEFTLSEYKDKRLDFYRQRILSIQKYGLDENGDWNTAGRNDILAFREELLKGKLANPRKCHRDYGDSSLN